MSTAQAEIGTEKIPVFNPATQQVIGTVPNSTREEVFAAVERARRAEPAWATSTVRERLKIIEQFQQILTRKKEKVAELITAEAGKPRGEALATEVLVVLDAAQFALNQASAFLLPERIPHANVAMKLKKGVLLREPYGVIGIISPWNYPFSIPAVEAISALVTGNAVVLKPSELTPFTSLELRSMFLEAGLPEGLLQVITGDGSSGGFLLESPIHKLVFTGSVATGKRVAQAAAARLLPVVLELGGKDPMLVLEDADVEVASSAAVWGAFMNAGQTCLSVERCYVHHSIYPRFLEQCVAKTQRLQVGNGMLDDTDVGPMIHQRQLQTVRDHVQDALERGARLLAGGKTLPELGPNYYAPTVLADVDHAMRIMREETFGPVLPVRSFRSEDEAIELANDSEFGLAASVWTRDRRHGEAVAGKIHAGTVMVNDVIACFGISEAPHGGVKASGIGRTHGRFGLEEMVWPKYVDSDRLPRMKKLWWYGYGEAFTHQMAGFIEMLFSKNLTKRILGGAKSAESYRRRKPV